MCTASCAVSEALQGLKVHASSGISLQDPRAKVFCVITADHGLRPFTILIRPRASLEDLAILKLHSIAKTKA